MAGFLLPNSKIDELAETLSLVHPRDRSGEKIEDILANIIPNAIRLPKDKKWFDIKVEAIGIECKTFLYDNISPNSFRDNVLKRVSQVSSIKAGKLKPAKQVGAEIISYLSKSIEQHAVEKNITGRKILSVLARGVDGISFAYWESPLNFGKSTGYTWYWNGKNTLVGDKGRKHIFSWYQNQKQLFYRWEIPSNAIFFKAHKYDDFKMSRAEYKKHIEEAYLSGYNDQANGRKPKY